MSFLNHVSPYIRQIRTVGVYIADTFSKTTSSQKIVLVTVTVSVALLGILAKHTRRKRHVPDLKQTRRGLNRRTRASGFRSPNGDVCSLASSSRRSEPGRLRSELFLGGSERASVASGSGVVTTAASTTHLTPQQLGVMGMEALETGIRYWEDALAAYAGSGPAALLSADEADLCRELQTLLDAAYALQDHSELLFLDQRSVLFRPDEGAAGAARSPSVAETFASAVDQIADLRDFDDPTSFAENAELPALYQSALKQLEGPNSIPCRTLRTDLVRCGSDNEYLAKLHCLRLAFGKVTKNPATWNWFADAGRQTLADLLLYADRDPKDFLLGYESMMIFARDPTRWQELETELTARGVMALTFYDVVLDYILMDAFEDLDSPPASVTAVVQNRWLSDGFKETALTTAVWSVLKAKRGMLKNPSGFMAHFYVISEQLVPLLAWGFLGPDEALRDTCIYFRDQVMALLVDMFSFHKTRFSTVDELAEDVVSHLTHRLNNISQRLCAQQ